MHRLCTEQADGFLLPYARQQVLNGGWVNLIGFFAFPAQQHGFVGSMPLASGTQRTKQFATNTLNRIEQARFAQCDDEHARGAHRAHRVGT